MQGSTFCPHILEWNFQQELDQWQAESKQVKTCCKAGFSHSHGSLPTERKQSRAQPVVAACDFWPSVFPKDYSGPPQSEGRNMTKDKAADVSASCKSTSSDSWADSLKSVWNSSLHNCIRGSVVLVRSVIILQTQVDDKDELWINF